MGNFVIERCFNVGFRFKLQSKQDNKKAGRCEMEVAGRSRGVGSSFWMQILLRLSSRKMEKMNFGLPGTLFVDFTLFSSSCHRSRIDYRTSFVLLRRIALRIANLMT